MAESKAKKKTAVAKKPGVRRTAKPKVAKVATPKAPKVAAGELSAPLFTSAGKSTGTVSLPASVFGTSWNSDLVHQVTLGMQANARAGNGRAHTKGRGEVRGGGKKPWKQKGTGRARHGSIRSPIWKGGGTTHGPRAEKNYAVSIPKKMRAKALYTVLSRKFRDGEVLFVDALSFAAPKTSDAMNVVNALSKVSGFEKFAKKTGNTALFVLPGRDEKVLKSFRNIGTTDVEEARNLNALDVLSYTYVVIVNPEDAVKTFESKMN